MTTAKDYRCLVLFKRPADNRWICLPNGDLPGWGRDRVSEPGNGKTYFDMADYAPGDYQIIRMEWYDTHGSGQPRSYFVRVTEIPVKVKAIEVSMAQAEYGAR